MPHRQTAYPSVARAMRAQHRPLGWRLSVRPAPGLLVTQLPRQHICLCMTITGLLLTTALPNQRRAPMSCIVLMLMTRYGSAANAYLCGRRDGHRCGAMRRMDPQAGQPWSAPCWIARCHPAPRMDGERAAISRTRLWTGSEHRFHNWVYFLCSLKRRLGRPQGIGQP